MPEKRLLYFTSRGVSAFGWKAGRMTAEARFANREDSIPEFSRYVAAAPKALYHVLVDVVEEDFHQENIPYVRGKDRRTLLGRKLAQRYRDLSLALALSLGYESGPRREEKILFSSFTNTQQFQPWLTVLRSCQARLVGVYSVPLVAPAVGRRIGFTGERYLLVSLQQGGLRQTYVESGRIRFSRLGRADSANPEDIANECATESGRIQQYLTNVRILPRDAGPLDIVVLAPAGQLAVFRERCANTALLQFRIMDLDASCRKAGLRSWPDGLLGERLFLHALAAAPGNDQFARDEDRRHYQLWRARVALLSGGAGIFVFCGMLAGLRALDMVNIQQLTRSDTDRTQALSAEYARLQERFPKTPTTSENLKLLVEDYRLLQSQEGTNAQVFRDVSRALAAAPEIQLDKIDWQVGGQRKPAPSGVAAPAPAPSGDARYETIEISGRVTVAQASDYRAITRVVEQFLDALRRQPGIEILATRLPFDIAAETTLSGDIGDERSSDVPQFTVQIARRLGA